MRKKSEARSLAPRWPKYARRHEFTTPGQGTHMCLACCGLGAVAQIFNLPYLRIGLGRASDGPTHRNFPTPRRVQLCDTAERGEAATKGARVCDPQERCRPPGVLTNPAWRSLPTCCGSQSRVPQNLLSPCGRRGRTSAPAKWWCYPALNACESRTAALPGTRDVRHNRADEFH